MNCAEALEGILGADPSVLEGDDESALARHLRECPGCREMARLILREEEALARDLVDAVASPDLDALLRPSASPEDRRPSPSGGMWKQRAAALVFEPRRIAYTLLPVAAAAALATLFLGRTPELPGDPYIPAESAPGLEVEVPEGRNVAVLATENPDITVLWLF